MVAVAEPGVRSQAAALEVIRDYDMTHVRARLGTHEGVPEEECLVLEEEYKKYLQIIVMHPGVELPMSEPIDEFGHTHLMFTRDFRAMCDAILPGSRIHHTPTITEQDCIDLLPDYRGRTLPLFTQRFGPPNPAHWPPDRCVCKWAYEP